MKKFGTFGGVFTPSILTILGVIMYLRLGWVVGHAGLIGAIAIIIVAHVISVSTGLSVSSIATNKKVGAGGIYYILSRSMGTPIGGAIGIALYVGTALSISLYLIGFAESFNLYFGLSTDIHALQLTGAIALIVLTAIALISTSVAIKTQYIILVAIVLSLLAIFFGVSHQPPETVQYFPVQGKSISLEKVFAIFFPAVTGFTAGIAMSGDLKDPKKSIPIGTLAAVAVGFIVYVSLAIFLAYNVDFETLRNDNTILTKIAWKPILVFLGIWGATLSSALGGILGGPRILQAMSIDKITPRIFGIGKGKNNEPVNALLLVFVIAFGGVMIGKLDDIARIVSMFYLSAYGFINISFFLESWANPDFQPTFKVKRWVGLLGFVACFGVMFKLDALAMFGAIAIIMGIYFWLKRKQIMLESGDVWQSVWENVVAKGLKKLETKEKVSSNWNPNIILFSGDPSQRPYLLELSKTVAGRTGIVTNFDLVVQSQSELTRPKTQQAIQDDTLEKMGIFGRRVVVDNIYKGVENIASTFGFSGIDPNTIMMGWPKNVTDHQAYNTMTQKLIRLDYNLLYLDYDDRYQFGNRSSIDVWWRETDNNNAELMLNIARFISQSPEWEQCKIRVLFVNHNNVDNVLVKSKISNLLEDLRLDAEIKIINNGVEQKSFYEIIKVQSAKTNLILLGIPNFEVDKQADFILKTNYLFETIGSTLLVKASNNFNEIELDFSKKENVKVTSKIQTLKPLPTSTYPVIEELVRGFDAHLAHTSQLIAEPALTTISSFYYQLLNQIKVQFEEKVQKLNHSNNLEEIIKVVQDFLYETKNISLDFKKQKLPALEETFGMGISAFINERQRFIDHAMDNFKIEIEGRKKTVVWKKRIAQYSASKLLMNTQFTLYEFGVQQFVMMTKIAEDLASLSTLFVEQLVVGNGNHKDILHEYVTQVNSLLESMIVSNSRLPEKVLRDIQNYERNLCVNLVDELENNKKLSKQKLNKKDLVQVASNVKSYSSDWYRNQLLSHSQAETNLDLATVGLSVVSINERLKNQVKNQVILPEESKVNMLKEITQNLEINLEQGVAKEQLLPAQELEQLEMLAKEIEPSNLSHYLETEEENLMALSRHSVDIVDLLSEDSFNNLIKVQNEEVTLVSLDITTIEDYILHSKYLSPLHQIIQELENKYRESSEKLYYAANLIKHLVEDISDEEDKNQFAEVLQDAKNRIRSCQETIGVNSETFSQMFNANMHNTLSDLNVRALLANADSLSYQAQQPLAKSKSAIWLAKKKEGLSQMYHQVVEFVVQRKRDIDTLKQDEKFIKYQNNIQRVNRFLSQLSLAPEVENALPFYYHKLFSGSHLGNANNRNKETETVRNVLHRIDQGVSGAILITGESYSGKSYFTEHMSNALLKGKKYYINPPFKQKFEVNDLHLAFQEAMNQSGTTENILTRLPANSILVFNDLEEWWMKNSKGDQVINFLVKIIEQFGNKHYFLLNCNLYSFEVMRQTTHIDQSLLATIVMSPLNKDELYEVIINRHRTAGADLNFDKDLLASDKKMKSLIADIHANSHGNIGLALNNWLRSITMDDNNQLTIHPPESLRFPALDDAQWKLVLYHFILHYKLTPGHVQGLFGSHHEWIESTFDELEKSGLIYKSKGRSYQLKEEARNYIERWLTSIKILNE